MPISIAIPEEKKFIPFQAYNILTTLLEKEFDELCTLASAICQTPVALIKLLEEEKPFIKAAVSQPIPLSTNHYLKYAETVAFADDPERRHQRGRGHRRLFGGHHCSHPGLAIRAFRKRPAFGHRRRPCVGFAS